MGAMRLYRESPIAPMGRSYGARYHRPSDRPEPART